MLRAIKRIFRRPPIGMGMVKDSSSRRSPLRSAGFVSFFQGNNCVARRNTDHFDARLRRQKFFKTVTVIAVTLLCTWFVIESAQALSTF
jgi:hypothetical protein